MTELLGPADEHSLWLKPLALQPKDTTICCGLNKMRYCIRQCLAALSSFFGFTCFIHTVLCMSVKTFPVST